MKADILIAGAGSAGCLIAAQLAQQTGLHVVLLEPPPSSPAEESSPGLAHRKVSSAVERERPANWIQLIDSELDWGFQTEPCDALANRILPWPRGLGVGGSSQINAMIWIPPTNDDLERLRAQSGNDWTREELSRSLADVKTLVEPETPRWHSEVASSFLEFAGRHCSALDRPMLYQRFNRQGRRWTAATFIDRLVRENRIEVIRALVNRVSFDGQRATGVVTSDANGNENFISATRGVILSAGAIGSPTILLRSGIKHQMLGKNLQDHLIMPLVYRMAHHEFPTNPNTMQAIARWQHAGTGRLVCNLAECGGLFHVPAGDPLASEARQVQLHVTPTHYLTYPQTSGAAMMSIGVNLANPKSRGSIRLHPTKPMAPPQIDSGYLRDRDDLDGLVQAVIWLRRWLSGSTRPPRLDWEVLPGPKRTTHQAIARSIARYAQTLYHPVGTCAAGADETFPIDTNFQVRNKTNLWVIDASVFREIPSVNPSATLLMLAHLAGQRMGRVLDQANACQRP